MRIIKNQNKHGKTYFINLTENEFSWRLVWLKFKRLGLSTLVIAIVGALIADSKSQSGLSLLFYVVILLAWIVGGVYLIHRKLFKGRRSKFHRYKPYERELERFIIMNNLYEEDSTGIYNHLFISYMELPKTVFVYVHKRGDRYQNHSDDLGERLESMLGLYLQDVDASNTKYTEYSFAKEQKEKFVFSNDWDLPSIDYALKFELYPGVTIDLRNNFSTLISGASGGGKSYFTYAFLTRFISQTVMLEKNGKRLTRHAKVALIDPKMSDAYKLMQVSGMPVEFYGSSVSDAFRILRGFIDEMNRRKEIYNQSEAFNTVALNLGLPPMLLVLEEYSSLVAMMDSKQKKEFESLLAQLTQQSRQLSMGTLIVMQQPRADSLSSNIREQLGNAYFMGNPSKEASGMMFGTSDVPKVSGRGSGIYSIERSAPKAFEAPYFENDVIDTILPVFKDVVQFYKEEGQAFQEA